jgi:hypothetical protein
MQDLLKDIVSHTHNLGFLNIVKITGDEESTKIDSMADDRSVIMYGEVNGPVAEMIGVFGMPQLNKLKIHLDCPEYRENAKIEIMTADRNGDTIPVGLHFENAAGDFKNDYRFMSTEAINEKLKSVKFKGVPWHVTFVPTVAGIQRFKFQAQANHEENTFIAKTENGDLKFYFGDHSTHAGNFVFHSGVQGKLSKAWSWPVLQFIGILNLDGDKTVQISDDGAVMITVDSGLIKYEYILPAMSK